MLCSGAGKHRSHCCDSGKMEAASIQFSRIAKKLCIISKYDEISKYNNNKQNK